MAMKSVKKDKKLSPIRLGIELAMSRLCTYENTTYFLDPAHYHIGYWTVVEGPHFGLYMVPVQVLLLVDSWARAVWSRLPFRGILSFLPPSNFFFTIST